MKQKHLYSLLDQTFTTVRVKFERKSQQEIEQSLRHKHGASPIQRPWADDYDRGERAYVYKVPKAWNVAVDDQLIVLTSQSGLSIVTVVHVDLEPDIDIDANHDYKWAVQKIDLTEFRDLTEREKAFKDQMTQIERVKQRESLVNSFRDSLPEGSEARRLFEATTTALAPPTPPQAPADFPLGSAQAGMPGGNS